MLERNPVAVHRGAVLPVAQPERIAGAGHEVGGNGSEFVTSTLEHGHDAGERRILSRERRVADQTLDNELAVERAN
ncbi:hypothetical protein ACLMAL_06655 [Nocardia sp. CWNU-33]|uniref:hypothetical protein n=1 Tax=Nocardia sp. CWNU-33 TaxID=3392117 RepID=UPI00398F59E1